MNWKTILVYLLIFTAGIMVGKIRISARFNKGSCDTSLIDKYRRMLNESDSSEYL